MIFVMVLHRRLHGSLHSPGKAWPSSKRLLDMYGMGLQASSQAMSRIAPT
jgi:hypothetical protein